MKLPNYQNSGMIGALARLGYDLATVNPVNDDSGEGVEELIVKILSEYPDPGFIEGIPVVLAKNEVDYARLVDLASERGALKPLGWILDVSRSVYDECGQHYSGELSKAIEKCRGAIDSRDTALGEVPDSYVKLSVFLRDEIAKKWCIAENYPQESIKTKLRDYALQQTDTI